MERMMCSLDRDVNNCRYFDVETGACARFDKCTYQYSDSAVINKYVRQPRWYEKYYRKVDGYLERKDSMSMYDDFSKYINPPECPVEVGMLCSGSEYLMDDTVYRVLDIKEKDDKWYATCEYEDAFSGEKMVEDIWAYYLKPIKEGGK